MKQFIFVLFLIFGLTGQMYSEEYKFEMKGVKASLISEAKSISPGQKFTVALFIQHFDGFHTYWKNPGMVGFATSLRWDLPKGFKAGNIQWQVPERSKMLKYNCHAYKSDTYLLVDIQAPNELPENIKIAGKVGGMSCSTKECCKIGYIDVAVDLAKSSKTEYDFETKARIDQARRRLPLKNKAYSFSAKRIDDSIVFKVASKDLPNNLNLYFYAGENIADTEKEQIFTLEGGKLQLKLKLNEYAAEDLKVFKGLLYSEDGWGKSGRKYLPVECSLEK